MTALLSLRSKSCDEWFVNVTLLLVEVILSLVSAGKAEVDVVVGGADAGPADEEVEEDEATGPDVIDAWTLFEDLLLLNNRGMDEEVDLEDGRWRPIDEDCPIEQDRARGG